MGVPAEDITDTNEKPTDPVPVETTAPATPAAPPAQPAPAPATEAPASQGDAIPV